MSGRPPRADRRQMTLGEVPDALKRWYGVTVTRQTVWRWATRGRQGVKLQTVPKSPISNTRTTTREWIRDFMAATGQ